MDEKEEETKEEVPEPPKEETKTFSELDRAEAANKEKKELLEREEKLQERKEKLHAIQMVGGKAEAGGEAPKPPEISDKEYAEKALSGELNVKKE